MDKWNPTHSDIQYRYCSLAFFHRIALRLQREIRYTTIVLLLSVASTSKRVNLMETNYVRSYGLVSFPTIPNEIDLGSLRARITRCASVHCNHLPMND